jgi:hypothetical protein
LVNTNTRETNSKVALYTWNSQSREKMSEQDIFWLAGLGIVLVIGALGFWGKSQHKASDHKAVA